MKIFDLFLRNKRNSKMYNRVNEQSGNITTVLNAYENDIYRGAIDSIARHVAKLKATCQDKELEYLLQVEPNAAMNSFDLLYKVVTHYYLKNNAFIQVKRNAVGKVTALIPLNYTTVEVFTDGKDIELEFRNEEGTAWRVDYLDLIHLKRHYNNSDILGDSNNAIQTAVDLAETINQGIKSNIEKGTNVRGILQIESVLNDDRLQEEHEKFNKQFLSVNNRGGVVTVDKKRNYTPINYDGASINVSDLNAISKKIYNYLGVNEKIIDGTFDEDIFNAFYESTIEPLALQLSLEFTRKVLTDTEKKLGFTINFESGRMTYTSNKTKANLLEHLVPYGLVTINQAREMLNLPPVENGNIRLQSLTMIDTELAKEYQLKKGGGKNGV